MREDCSWCKAYTASFHSFSVKTKHAHQGTEIKFSSVCIAKMCCISDSHQKLRLWHVHVLIQSGHSETMPATNCISLAALTRNGFHRKPKSSPAWSSCL